MPTRRQLLATLAASALFRPAQASNLGQVMDKAASFDQLHAIVIQHKGQLLEAKRFRGAALEAAANVKSVSKTIVASLTGIAIGRGELPGVGALMADYIDIPKGADPRIAGIRVEDLVTMRAGLERTSGRNYGSWVNSRHWLNNALLRPFVAEPGGRFLYSTGSFHLLGAVLSAATGLSLLAQMRERIGRPLGIDVPPWTRDPQGHFMGGNNMALSPLALARFGQLWLDQGRSGDAQIIDPGWIESSWIARTRSPFSGHDYGYGWFLTSWQNERIAYARGYGGQMLFVVPGRDLVVAITSDPTRPARSHGYAGQLHGLLHEIMAAV